MSPKRKTSSDALFDYLKPAFKVNEFARILEEVNGIFRDAFFIWTVTFFVGSTPPDYPEVGEETIYAIDPFAKLILELNSEDQDPRTGRLIEDQNTAGLILTSIVASVEVLLFLSGQNPDGHTPSSRLFELINYAFESEVVSEALLQGGGIFVGNYFIWPGRNGHPPFYAINPIHREVRSLQTKNQAPHTGQLVPEEQYLLFLLKDLHGYLEEALSPPSISFLPFFPGKYKAIRSFSLS